MRQYHKLHLLVLGALLLASSVSVSSCAKNVTVPKDPRQGLLDASNASKAISEAANGYIKVVLIAMPNQSEERKAKLAPMNKLIPANQSARKIIESLNELDDPSKAKLAEIFKPVFVELHAGIDTGLFGIKNPESQSQANMYLELIKTAIGTLETVLGVTYGNR